MALKYLLSPTFQMVNTAGKPATGGYIEVYVHGTRDKYYCASDFDGTLHPFRIPLDSLGSNIILADDANAYDIYVYNRYGSLLMSRYNVTPLSLDDIAESLARKKDKQNPISVKGSPTQTLKSITQDANGEIDVKFEDIDFPYNIQINSPDDSIEVGTPVVDPERKEETIPISVKRPGLVKADSADTAPNTLIDKMEVVSNEREPDEPTILQLETTVDGQGTHKVAINEDNLRTFVKEVDNAFEDVWDSIGELPNDEHGYFNSSLYTTPGDGTTESLLMDNFRISEGRSVHGDNIEFVPTHQEGGVDFGEVYLEPGTYIFTVDYTLQWVGNPRGTFLPLVANVGEQPFDFSYEHEDALRTTRIVTKTTRGKFGLNFPFDADTPQMGIWVKRLEIAQIASYNHPAVTHDSTLEGSGQIGDPLGVTTDVFSKVKDIPTSISQFRNGDVIPVDGPNGPAKMPKDDLLKETAQNALAGNVAPEFVPNSTTSVVGRRYVYNGLLYVAKEDGYKGPWDTSKFERTAAVNTPVRFLNPNTSASPWNDLDAYPVNSIVLVSVDQENVSHRPSDVDAFTVYTFGAYSGVVTQILSSSDSATYIRSKWNSWGSWVKVEKADNIKHIINPSGATAPYNDLDTYPRNSIVLVANDTHSSVSNKPVEKAFQVYTFGNVSNVLTQILVDSSSVTWMRSLFGTGWGSWIQLKNYSEPDVIKKYINPDTTQAPFNDLDTFPNNSLVGVFTATAESLPHNPSGNQFHLYTFGAYNGVTTQILGDANRRTWVRTKFNSWGSWVEIKDYTVDTSKFFKRGGALSSGAYSNDLDNMPGNSIYACTDDAIGAAFAHKPVNDDNQFVVSTFTAYSDSTNICKIQMYVTSSSKETYIRSKWASWGSWVKIEAKEQTIFTDVLSAFNNIICVGDSLTYSQVYTSENGSRQAYRTYPDVLGTITGATTTSYASGGDSATDAWNRHKNSFESKTNALAIIYLGTNGGLTDTLATDAPENESYTDWASTNTGSYAKIVARLQELGYKILLVKVFASTGNVTTTNGVIEQVADRFGCAYVEPISNSALKFHYFPDGTGYNSVHFNDFGYAWFAKVLSNMVSELPDANLKKIIPV